MLSNGKVRDSEPVYEEALSLDPGNETALYNLGMAYFQTAEYDKAAARWQKLKSVAPDDWRLRAKLIQTYQALGDTKKRDLEHQQLLELREKANSQELNEAVEFCREQGTITGGR